MPITNTNPSVKEAVFFQRSNDNIQTNEVHASGSQRIPHINTNGDLDFDTSSSFYSLYPPSITSIPSSVAQVYIGSFLNPNGNIIPSNSFVAAEYSQDITTPMPWLWSVSQQNWYTMSCCPNCSC